MPKDPATEFATTEAAGTSVPGGIDARFFGLDSTR